MIGQAARIAVVVALGALFGALSTAATAAAAAGTPAQPADFAPEELLMTERELEVFGALRHPSTRERFLERFWTERSSEVRSAWDKRLPLAASEFGNLASDRARLFMTAGPPRFRVADLCASPIRKHEIWYYGDDSRTVVFVEGPSPAGYMTWRQRDWGGLLEEDSSGVDASEMLSTCQRGAELRAALIGSTAPERLPDLSPTDPEWTEQFLRETTLLPQGAELFEASVALAFPAAVGEDTAVQIALEVPGPQAAAQGGTQAGQRTSGRALGFALTGEIFGERPADAFRLELAATEVASAEAPIQPSRRMVVRRHLPPGTYELVLKLHDLTADRYFSKTLPLDVPAVDHQEPGWVASGQEIFKLLPPPEGYLTGSHRFGTVAGNPEIAKVAFYLDDERVMAKNRPPFSVEIDLGVVPRPREVLAIASDKRGFELARDRLSVNSGPHRFAVRLVAPQRGARTEETVRLHAEVDTPLGERLSTVEFFWNETRLARLHQPPFVQTFEPPQSSGSSYVRAVATLDDGHSAEDLVVVNTGDTIEAIDIDFVELYASVIDKERTAVEGLERDDFRVFENDVEQDLRRFETVDSLPVNAVVMLDSSISMEEEIRDAERAAAQFFEDVLEPKDRAAVIVFNDTPQLRVPLTNDTVLLNNGLAGIEADGETSLHDSLIYGLYYLAGLRGKRALVLLSDGEDSASKFSFDDALEYAKRSGVAIYAIGLGVGNTAVAEYAVLRSLARETGGDSFFIASARGLDRIYERIEQDLRSQYLLGYQSPQLESRDYRTVRVEVVRDGLEAKTVPGYYP